MDKRAIIAALDRWIRQRPGLEFGNYGDRKAYAAELRSITKDGTQAKTLLRAVERRDGITAEMLVKAAEGSFSGRLSITERNGKVVIDYSTGQYWPTEYRRAVCAVLASALWDYWRECRPSGPNRETLKDGTVRYWLASARRGKGDFVSAGDWLRGKAREEFGHAIASRWFN
jgi:hypothetical protein